ncbi:MAG: OmpA family protein, partial [Gammaproteobacteria bacterium]|nr:OmpA family protein [Gammaproteobacteria bacterium]
MKLTSKTLVIALFFIIINPAVADIDGDGVRDQEDACPQTASDIQVNEQGCEIDSDADGVVDRVDNCPKSTPGALTTTHGCEHDSDLDGVFDHYDRCPSERDVRVDAVGCPLTMHRDRLPIYFAPNSDHVPKAANNSLEQLAATLKHNADLNLIITGHTDDRGRASHNQSLSENRAVAVKRALQSYGVSPSRLQAMGRGEQQPIADNESEQGRRQNRRISVTFLQVDQTAAQPAST